MSLRKNSLTRVFIQRVAIIFALILLVLTLFYRWGFPTYYYWKMEQPVKEAQKLIQNGKEKEISDELVVIALDNSGTPSEEELTNDITFRLSKEGIALHRFWVDKSTIRGVQQGQSVQRLYNQTRQRNDFYTVFFSEGNQFYLVGTSIPDFQAAVRTLFPILIAVTVLFLLLLFALIILLVRNQIIQPIRRLEQTTRNISKLNFTDSDNQEENELGQLSQSINQMKRSLQQHEMEMLERNDQLKAFSSNLAHELKTPLSIMQLLVDGEQMGLENPAFLEDIDQQLLNMNALVTNLLAYSQQMKETIQFERINISSLLEKEVAQERLIDQTFQIDLKTEACELETNPQLLSIVLTNLLTNSMKYSLDKQVKITGNKQESQYQIMFENRANPLSQQQFSHLKEPFVVGEKSRNSHLSGTGLGLSIVEQTLRLIGGEFTLRQENHSFLATIVLPIQQTAQ